MNAYLVDGGYYYAYSKLDADTASWGRDVELVFAATPGKAKSLFLRDGRSHDASFTELKVKLVAKGVERPEGIAAGDDGLWERV